MIVKYYISDVMIWCLFKGFIEILVLLGLVINKSIWKIEGNEVYLCYFVYIIFMDLICDIWFFDYI